MFRSGKPVTTGRKIILFAPTTENHQMQAQSIERSDTAIESREALYLHGPPADPKSVFLPNLGVAIVASPPPGALTAESLGPDVEFVEDETYLYAVGADDYARGFRDSAQALYAGIAKVPAVTAAAAAAASPPAYDQSVFTWGLQVTNVATSSATGTGVKVAILDSGLDQTHPDFAGRTITAYSTIPNQSNNTDDVAGHGTHVTGTSCGPKQPTVPNEPRYGIAFEAEIYVCKVLDDSGQGTDQSILAGIDWAISQGCDIISMSLGRPPLAGAAYSPIYEAVAKRALDAGTLIICAAGNESDRANGYIAPINHPANCPSIVAVAALDDNFAVANFSCGGPQMDLAAPGVDVLSSWPTPRNYRVLSGTSMATPHVSGISALWVATTQLKGAALRQKLLQTARHLAAPQTDVGSGLIQSPP